MRAVLIFILFLPHAFAALGAKEDSIEIDRQRASDFAVRAAPVNNPNYTVHEIVNGKARIREFVGADGNVFAVAWSGVRHPDLSTLLGNSWEEYSKSSKTAHHRRGRALRSVHGNNIVVEHGGHMRAVRGRAYIPSLLPSGVQLNEIR